MRKIKQIVIALGVTSLLLGPVGMILPGAEMDAAFAKGGNDGGNGGGNGGNDGNGNGGGKSTKSANVGGEKAAKAPKATKVAKAEKAADAVEETVVAKNAHGLLASELKGLNAVHANPNALLHASPNSQVGRIAAYRDAALATINSAQGIDDAQAALDEFDATGSGRTIAEIEADLGRFDPTDADFDSVAYDELGAELSNAIEREADRVVLADALTAAQDAAATAGATEADALLAAAKGRTLSPEAVAYIRAQLNL